MLRQRKRQKEKAVDQREEKIKEEHSILLFSFASEDLRNS